MKFVYAVGARPNFVKTAPVIAEMRRRLPDASHVVVHTGQHYDRMMSDVFLDQLGVGRADHTLGVGSGSHAVQIGRVMERLEPVLDAERPDFVTVSGDVNSTLGVALVAAKCQIPLAHIESGLRSHDRTMPEELNRIVADESSELLFVHCQDAVENLRREGVGDEGIHFVGNTMIDTLVLFEQRFRAAKAWARLGLRPGGYLLVTLHRPPLVDSPLLGRVMDRLSELAQELPVVFPVHPRTQKMLDGRFSPPGVLLCEPLGYLDFLSLEVDAAAVLTDSGGIQEETTFLGVPCFTLRDNTERPVTIRAGTNTLLGLDPDRIRDILPALRPPDGSRAPPPLWDGAAATRVADVLERAVA